MDIKNINRAQIDFTEQNIRPIAAISAERIAHLAASIEANQGSGVLNSGLEQAVRVYAAVLNAKPEDAVRGLGGTRYLVEDGQERVLALDSLGISQVPCAIVEAPADIWAATKRQLMVHDNDPFDIFTLVTRAVELKDTPMSDGKPATWNDVAAVMGKNAPYWSHRQHLLALTPTLRQALLQGRIREELAAYVGRDLTPELQDANVVLLCNTKQRMALETIIKKINGLAQVDLSSSIASDEDAAAIVEDIDLPEPTDTDDDDGSDADLADREVRWLLQQLTKLAERLAKLDASQHQKEIERIKSLL